MKKNLLSAALALVLAASCTMNTSNPLLQPSPLPHGAPAFDKIQISHYKPAMEAALATAKAEIQAIIENPEAPTFANTLEALEASGRDLGRVAGIFYNLNSSLTGPEMQALAQELSPMMTEYSMSILLNAPLFQRVKAVYDQRGELSLDPEQARLLEETYKSFARNGANLSPEDKAAFAKIQEELSLLSLQFEKNTLSANNAFVLHLTDTAHLAGLPTYVREMGAAEAKARELEGWVYTLDTPSYGPFLKFSEKRDLKERMWTAANTLCAGGEFDNTGVLTRILELRTQEAQLLGYPTYAAYSLEETMAKTPATVHNFLAELMDKSLPFAQRDVAQIRDYAAQNGFTETLMPWDFSYWCEKYKQEKYALNEELLKPYFELGSVRQAVFDLAGSLYGLQFKESTELPVYHPDAHVFEVFDQSNRFMALLYMDFFPRESKRSGAWMNNFREQGMAGGVEERPIITVVTNFTKPTETTPSLLTFGEVTTLLHEFGHALHGILAQGKYSSLTGTNVARDFVELPSQIMENWAYEPEFLQRFAKHYQSGEALPQEYIDRIIAAKNFLAGYGSIRQLQFGYMDMQWHDAATLPQVGVVEHEAATLKPWALLPTIKGTAFSPAFGHIFAGGYAAGYYSYKWAEVLEADAFSLFKEKGIFNREVAAAFRDKILSRGGIEDADVLYRNFRGRDPQPEALLRKLGME